MARGRCKLKDCGLTEYQLLNGRLAFKTEGCRSTSFWTPAPISPSGLRTRGQRLAKKKFINVALLAISVHNFIKLLKRGLKLILSCSTLLEAQHRPCWPCRGTLCSRDIGQGKTHTATVQHKDCF